MSSAPAPSGDESGAAAPAPAAAATETADPAAGAAVVNPVGAVDPSPSTPVSRGLAALRPPWREAMVAVSLLVTGGLLGASLVLTLLLTNVVRSLPPSAVLPRPNGSAVVIIHAPNLDPGSDTVTLPPPQYPDYRDRKDSPIPQAAPGGMDRYDDATRYGSGARLSGRPPADPDLAGSNPCRGCHVLFHGRALDDTGRA